MKNIQQDLLREIGKRLTRFGFGPKAAGQSFYRPIPAGREIFHLTFIAHKSSFDVTGDVAVRIDELEDLVNKDSPLLSDSEKRKTASIGAELGNIAAGVPMRWTVKEAGDVDRVGDSIVAEFAKTGATYLDQYANPDAILSALQSNEKESWLHSPIHEARCRRIVGLTALLKRPDDLGDAISKCDEFLSNRDDPGLIAFRHFISTVIRPLFAPQRGHRM